MKLDICDASNRPAVAFLLLSLPILSGSQVLGTLLQGFFLQGGVVEPCPRRSWCRRLGHLQTIDNQFMDSFHGLPALACFVQNRDPDYTLLDTHCDLCGFVWNPFPEISFGFFLMVYFWPYLGFFCCEFLRTYCGRHFCWFAYSPVNSNKVSQKTIRHSVLCVCLRLGPDSTAPNIARRPVWIRRTRT